MFMHIGRFSSIISYRPLALLFKRLLLLSRDMLLLDFSWEIMYLDFSVKFNALLLIEIFFYSSHLNEWESCRSQNICQNAVLEIFFASVKIRTEIQSKCRRYEKYIQSVPIYRGKSFSNFLHNLNLLKTQYVRVNFLAQIQANSVFIFRNYILQFYDRIASSFQSHTEKSTSNGFLLHIYYFGIQHCHTVNIWFYPRMHRLLCQYHIKKSLTKILGASCTKFERSFF